MKCGHEKTYTGASRPLVCELEPGHPLPHAMLSHGRPYVRWPVAWTDEDERRHQETLAARLAEVEPKKKKR
jgi:hypothetical protein